MDVPVDAENTVRKQHKASNRVPLGEIAPNKREAPDALANPPVKRSKYVELEQVPTAQVQQIYGADEGDEIACVPEYAEEIFAMLFARQVDFMVDANYMDHQPEIKWNVRDILVNWLLQVHSKFRLYDETLYLCINIMDRYLSLCVVPLEELQLVGITSLFIASKYEEVFSPALENFAYVSKTTGKLIVEMEAKILAKLEYSLGYPNPLNFLRRVSKADDSDTASRSMAKYMLEISVCNRELLKFRPSDIAAAAMYLGRLISGRTPAWDTRPELVHYSGGLSSAAMAPVLETIVRYMVGPIVHPTLFKKYASNKYLRASIQCRRWAKENMQDFLSPDEVAAVALASSDESDNN